MHESVHQASNIVIKAMWMCCLNIFDSTGLTLLVMMWYKKCLYDEIKWGEWCNHSNIVFSYYWSSEDTSEGKSSSHANVDDWMLRASHVDG